MNSLSTPIKVAMVDDHKMITDSLTNLLHTIGGFHVCLAVQSGENLLQELKYCDALPDVCLLDVSMPRGMDGFETMASIAQHWPSIKCVAITMHGARDVIERMLKNGARGFVSKDAGALELAETIREVHYNGYSLQGLIAETLPGINEKNINKYARRALNDKQVQFLRLICSDLSYEEIGRIMNISTRTAEKYCQKLRGDLDIHSRAGLVLFAVYSGIEQIDYTHRERRT